MSLGLRIAIFNKIVSAFIFGYAFHLFKTQTIVKGNKDTRTKGDRKSISHPTLWPRTRFYAPWGASFPQCRTAQTVQPCNLATLLPPSQPPIHSAPFLGGHNIVALFNAFAIAHCICWNFSVFFSILFVIFFFFQFCCEWTAGKRGFSAAGLQDGHFIFIAASFTAA